MTKVAIITGGASGIGFATTQLLACAGYRVGIADLNTPLAIDRVAELTGSGYEAFQLSLDVTNREECGTALEKVRHQHGLVTLVVNCAGVAGRSQIGDAASGAGWDRNIDINLTGSFNMVHGCIGQLKASGKGVVVNVSSVVGERSGFAEAGYAASKAGVIGLTRQLCRELAPFGIRVNCVAPGYIETPMLGNNLGDVKSWMDIHTPMKRLGQPREIAEAIVFLASDAASYINGATLPVDGGYLCV
ncbi:MAG: SDR family oxidoreductase [Rhodobacteraceae bacterium]|jgi:NAD(P)-dependent dehydrogenase (short-subunit alcohol dehydrogenase family)|nr:SDR family oxidoreductase [Paracoccaceae bacterium]